MINYGLDCMFILVDFVSRVTGYEVNQRDTLQLTKSDSLTDNEQNRAKRMLEKHFSPFSVNCRIFDIKFPVKRRRMHDANPNITWGAGMVVNQRGELRTVLVDASEMLRLNTGAVVEGAKLHGESPGPTNHSSPASPKDETHDTEKETDKALHVKTVRARLQKVILPMSKEPKPENV